MWQTGQYLNTNQFFAYLGRKRGLISAGTEIFSYIVYAIIGYSVFFIFFYKKRKKALTMIIYLFIAVPVMIFCRYLIQEILAYQIWGYHNYGEHMLNQPIRYVLDNMYFSIYYSAFGLVFFFVQLSGHNQKEQSELLLQNRNAELSFLRSQINPHFLFNNLNNIYALVYQSSAHALPAIGKLSELLRYMLYEKGDFVYLDKEIAYLHNFIDLQLLRYDYIPYKEIALVMPAKNTVKIAPLILIPFVENAFKHGDLKDPKKPLTITLEAVGNTVSFIVKNKKNNFSKDSTGGIGLDNVKKRLALLHPDNHTLNITETNSDFTVHLILIIHD